MFSFKKTTAILAICSLCLVGASGKGKGGKTLSKTTVPAVDKEAALRAQEVAEQHQLIAEEARRKKKIEKELKQRKMKSSHKQQRGAAFTRTAAADALADELEASLASFDYDEVTDLLAAFPELFVSSEAEANEAPHASA